MLVPLHLLPPRLEVGVPTEHGCEGTGRVAAIPDVSSLVVVAHVALVALLAVDAFRLALIVCNKDTHLEPGGAFDRTVAGHAAREAMLRRAAACMPAAQATAATIPSEVGRIEVDAPQVGDSPLLATIATLGPALRTGRDRRLGGCLLGACDDVVEGHEQLLVARERGVRRTQLLQKWFARSVPPFEEDELFQARAELHLEAFHVHAVDDLLIRWRRRTTKDLYAT
eukprot:2350625-Prymnesium_polylepis.1